MRLSIFPTATLFGLSLVPLAHGGNTALGAGTRQTVRPVLACTGTSSCGAFITTLELSDSVGGRTSAPYLLTAIVPTQ
jgi:hypothetical protein